MRLLSGISFCAALGGMLLLTQGGHFILLACFLVAAGLPGGVLFYGLADVRADVKTLQAQLARNGRAAGFGKDAPCRPCTP